MAELLPFENLAGPGVLLLQAVLGFNDPLKKSVAVAEPHPRDRRLYG